MVDRRDKKLADEIAGNLLHSFGRSLIDGKHDPIRSVFHVPCLIEVSGTARTITSKDELERTYKAVRDYCKGQDIRDVVSTIVSVDYLTSERLGIIGVVCLMRADDVRFNSPFPVYLMADREIDSWKISCTIYAINNAPELVAALQAK